MDWTHQLTLLLAAFGLSTVIGLERELRQKNAGLRTHTLVGVGAAVFTIVSKFGFGDVVSEGTVNLDPSRVAAQVVSGIGFIGAGVIFVRRADVRGLTTAAAVWLTAGVGMAAGAGLVPLAVGATAAHLFVAYAYTPLVRRLPASRRALRSIEVSYRDREGVLRRLLAEITGMDYVVSGLDVTRSDADRSIVTVRCEVEGARSIGNLVDALHALVASSRFAPPTTPNRAGRAGPSSPHALRDVISPWRAAGLAPSLCGFLRRSFPHSIDARPPSSRHTRLPSRRLASVLGNASPADAARAACCSSRS